MTASKVSAGLGYRIRTGECIAARLAVMVATTGAVIDGVFRVEYDDGSSDTLTIPPMSVNAVADPVTGVTGPASLDGWIVAGHLNDGSITNTIGSIYAKLFIVSGGAFQVTQIRQCIGAGYLGGNDILVFGTIRQPDYIGTYVFQGTVAEDATGGTHVCKLTVAPGAGNAFEVMGAMITVGATATAQTAFADVQDGSGNVINYLLDPNAQSATVSGLVYAIPAAGTTAQDLVAANSVPQAFVPVRVSGSMILVLQVNTAAVSVTQTFALSVRLRGTNLPTATLSDSVGTPVLTTNTSGLF